MTWVYEQRSGRLLHDGLVACVGYAGCGEGKNNPDAQDRIKIGPIPRGTYSIGAPYDTTTHGPYVLRLTPAAYNNMHGRAGFLIHGDSTTRPGEASEGCIIAPRMVRERVWNSEDRELEVVE